MNAADNNLSFNQARPIKIDHASQRRLITIYTVILVLRHMRDRLGMEAMLDFLDKYAMTVERVRPEIKEAVNNELLERALEDLYQTVNNYEQ